jgi:TRAP-type uncharacterized transport system substrate-binding protein
MRDHDPDGKTPMDARDVGIRLGRVAPARPGRTLLPLLAFLADACLLAGHPLPVHAADYDVRIRGRVTEGTIPPKAAVGEKDTVAVVGEPTGETEFLAADEIANAVASAMERGPKGQVALRVLAIPGKGGVQNVRDVLSRPNIDFGIAPLPVLEAAAATDGMGNLRKRIAYVAPLYFEEVHVLAGASVHDAADLEGKEVSLGEEGSSTEIVARTVLASLEVKVRPSNLHGQAAVDAVKDGKLAAAFVVSGKPVDSIGKLWGRTVRLLSLPADKVPEGFVPAVIDHSDYPDLISLGLKVRTYAVQNVLFGYNWPARSPRGKVGRTFLSVLLYRLSDLHVGGNHQKWREVNVAGFVPGWRRLPAMQAWLDASTPRVDGPASRAEFEAFLTRTNTKPREGNRETLYQDFLRWRTGPGAGDEQ